MNNSIGESMGRTKIRFLNRPSARFVVPDADIGLEFEYEGVRGVPTTYNDLYWRHKEDHSLHDRGLEFVFAAPLFGEDAAIAIETMMTGAKATGYKVSLRTGIHVHLDVRDLQRNQFVGMLAYYTLFEPLIYKWVGDDRESNNFCLPFYKAENSLDQAIRLTSSLFIEGPTGRVIARRNSESYGKYSGLNLRSMAQFGSVEFRHLRTTHDIDRVFTWINIILSLKRAAERVPASTTAGLLEPIVTYGLQPGTEMLLFQVFGEDLGNTLLSAAGNLQEVIGLGLPNALRILSATDALFSKIEKPRGNKYDPWGIPDEEPPEKEASKSHKAIRKWETTHFPKSGGQQLDEKPNTVAGPDGLQADRPANYEAR